MDRQNNELVVISKDVGDYTIMEDKKTEHIQYPLYMECYKYAIETILENSTKNGKNNSEDDSQGSPDNVNNIIAFCGGRGSGKTTAINEFGYILEQLNTKDERNWWISKLQQTDEIREYMAQNIHFTVLKSIDASLLTEKEDIVEMILAAMYEILEKKVQEGQWYDKEEMESTSKIISEFDMVYNSYHKLSRAENKAELGDSVSLILKNVPSGPKFRQAFNKLLNSFFDIVSGKKDLKSYLVVTIDDLDLNIDRGYEMLEQIHKYLSNKKIIVLIAVDYMQLSKVCDLYFKKKFKKGKKEEKYKGAEGLLWEIMQLTNDYLLKAIPIFNRIYMPDKRRFVETTYILENNQEKTIKDYVIEKVAEKTGIYYDIIGSKRHFAVPTTIRELVDYTVFLDSLYVVDWKKYEEEVEGKCEEEREKIAEKIIYQYKRNHIWMNRDITDRMAYQLLNYQQLDVFQRLTEKNILNRAQYAIEIISNWMQQKKEEQIDNKIYRYGDLLEKLYELGRKQYTDKVLVYCVLAFFTSEMTKEYYSFRYNRDEKEISQERLASLVGVSFGNSWLGDIFPRVKVVKDGIIKDFGDMGFIENAEIEKINIKFEKGGGHISKAKMKDLPGKILSFLKDNQIVEIIDNLLIFANARNEDGEKCIPEIKFIFCDVGKDKFKCEIKFYSKTVDFDLLSFMGRGNMPEERNALADKILYGLINGVNEITNENNEITIKECESIKAYIEEKLEGWREEEDWFLFPFYNLDLSYNVLKRVRKNRQQVLSPAIEADKIYLEIQKVYGYIAIELLREDKKYGLTHGFFDKFVNSGFIKQFGIIYPAKAKEQYDLKDITKEVAPQYGKILSEVVKVLALPSNAEQEILKLDSAEESAPE